MSKGNMFLGLARGSVGDLTFYRRNAQQITRVRVRNVKNPQSPAQMGQRAIQRTAVQAYGVLKSICDHSFEGVSYGANSYSRFLSLNMDMLRQKAAAVNSAQKSYCPSGFQGITAMPFIISKGSLPSIPVRFSQSGPGVYIFTMNGNNPQNVKYQDVITALNAQQGDQLTIIRIKEPTADGFPDEPLGRKMRVARIILDPGSGNDPAETEFFDTSGGGVLRVNDPNIRNEGNATFNVYTSEVCAGIDGAQANDFAYAAILSRQSPSGEWLRSDSALLYGELWNENGYTLKQASTLTPSDLYIENDYYLNNAE